MKDYIMFSRLVSPWVIRVVYTALVLGSFVVCFVYLPGRIAYHGLDGRAPRDQIEGLLDGIGIGAGSFVLFNVLLRLGCEGMFVIFGIHERLAELAEAKRRESMTPRSQPQQQGYPPQSHGYAPR